MLHRCAAMQDILAHPWFVKDLVPGAVRCNSALVQVRCHAEGRAAGAWTMGGCGCASMQAEAVEGLAGRRRRRVTCSRSAGAIGWAAPQGRYQVRLLGKG